jgi:hypothetical protein
MTAPLASASGHSGTSKPPLAELRHMLRRLERQVGILHADAPRVLSTGSAELDALLPHGGLPRGQLVEVVGPLGGGRLSFALLAAASAAKTGHSVALVDGDGVFYPPGASQLGVSLEQLCVVRPPGGQRVAWVAEQLARSRCFPLVIALPCRPLSEVQGRRLKQASEAGASALLVVSPQGSALPASLRLSVGPHPCEGGSLRATVLRSQPAGLGASAVVAIPAWSDGA